MKNDRLQHTIDLLKRCGEVKGVVITEVEMAAKAGLSLQELQAYLEGEEPAPVGLGAKLKAAYGGLIAAIRQDGYRSSLNATIRSIKGFGKDTGVVITEEEMALKIDLPLVQLQAYANGEQATPADISGRLWTAYDELYKEIFQRNLNAMLRSTMYTIQEVGKRQGREITVEDMAGQLGINGEELTACLQDPGITQDEFSALSDRLRAAYAALLKNVQTVHVTSEHKVETPLAVELDWDDWEEE